jgi:hypothetical protein
MQANVAITAVNIMGLFGKQLIADSFKYAHQNMNSSTGPVGLKNDFD